MAKTDVTPFKDRVFTTLYRLRYGWQFRSSVEISTEQPIWLLGTYYHVDSEGARDKDRDVEGAPPHVQAFMEHFYSVPWMTYRSNFPLIEGTSLTTDCGWGCMVRSGQMVLATALNRHLVGGDWRLPTSTREHKALHAKVLSWFADSPSAPFSIHSLMKKAILHDHNPGDWFGPSQVAVLMRECMDSARSTVPELEQVIVYVAHDCTVYVGDVLELFASNPDQALILLVPVRLGSEALNPIYIPCVQGLLSLDHCVGIIGGRPKHSVFFIGFQQDKLIHLDPHYCQSAQLDADTEQYDIKTYHCTTPRKISAHKMDPSCTIGFYCRGLEQFRALREHAEKVLAPPKQKGVYPFFTFSDMSLAEAIHSAVVDTNSLSEAEFQGEEFENLSVHSEDEGFVVVDCRRPPRSVSDPGTLTNTTGISRNISRLQSNTITGTEWTLVNGELHDISESPVDQLS